MQTLLPPPPPPPPPPTLFDGARWPHDGHGWQPEDAPRVRPLSYPGRWPDESILLTRHRHYTLHLQPGRRLGQARVALGDEADLGDGPSAVSEVSLNYVLARFNAPRPANRAPVLAVGSNAAPSQMRHKFARPGVSLVIPMALARIEGLASGLAVEISSVGYIPATPIVGEGLRSNLFVQWLDANQLATLDATEPGYRRVLIPAGDPDEGGVRVTLPSGEVLGAVYAYMSTRGCLVGPDGTPLHLGDQRDLITRLLDASRRLRGEMGGSADSWVEQVKVPGKVERVTEVFEAEGWIGQDAWLDRLAAEQDAPHGGMTPVVDSAAVTRSRMQDYGEILPATPPEPGSWRVVPSGPTVRRRAQAIVQVAQPIYDQLGEPRHVAVQTVVAAARADLGRLDAIARVRVDPDETQLDRVQVDYVIRDAIGVEVGETVHLTPLEVRRRHWPDRIIGPPLYVTLRVQAADLVTVEREVCLLSDLTLELLGVKSGDEVVIEGRPGDDGVVEQVRLKAFDTTEAVQHNRERDQGGDFTVRYPSARDALGIHPDIPWIFLDKTTRALLGLGRQQLATVRVRASRSFQLRQEVREMLLILVIALLGLVGLIDQPAGQIGIVSAMILVIGAAIVVRMRGRLSHRVTRSRRRKLD